MKQLSDRVLNGLLVFFHETLGLSPNAISTIGFVVGMIAAALVAGGALLAGLITMAVSQIIDGVDGGVARKYDLRSPLGQTLETVYDRSNELAMFLALAWTGAVSYRMAALAFTAIVLITIIEPKSHFDPGFKRFMIYFGYLAGRLFPINGFEIALQVVFFANLAGFVIGTILVDYRFQEEIDRQAIERKRQEIEAGIPQPPDDPPSFLSKVFS